jgi:twitching motility protein PilI
MANREALRELQSRLAMRLQVARTEGVAASWLAVEAGGGKYLFALRHSGEIFPWTVPQPVPYTEGWFLGVANLRGGLYGVVDLASFVGGGASVARSDLARSDSRLIALNPLLEVNAALLIDRLVGLRNPEAFVDSSDPPVGAPAYFGNGYSDASGAQWQEINLQVLSQQSEFLSISA